MKLNKSINNDRLIQGIEAMTESKQSAKGAVQKITQKLDEFIDASGKSHKYDPDVEAYEYLHSDEAINFKKKWSQKFKK